LHFLKSPNIHSIRRSERATVEEGKGACENTKRESQKFDCHSNGPRETEANMTAEEQIVPLNGIEDDNSLYSSSEEDCVE
jgi:hypothetical protein